MVEALPPDPFRVLGIDRNATTDAIKKAYRKAALRCHPDKTSDPAAVDEFHNIQQAYDLLSDDEKRQHYEATLRLHALRKDLQGGRAGTFPSARDTRQTPPRPHSFDEAPRAKADWAAPNWSSSRGHFQAEERAPPGSSDFPPPPPPPPRQSAPRQPSYEDDFHEPALPNRKTSRKDDSLFGSMRRSSAKQAPPKADSVKGASKPEKLSSKEKDRAEAKKMRDRELQRDRSRKFGAGPAMGDSDSSDGAPRGARASPAQPRRPSETPNPRSAAPRDAFRSDDEADYQSRQRHAAKEDYARSYLMNSGTAPPPSYRAPAAAADADGSGRRSSRDARPGGLFRRPSSRSASAKEPAPPSRPSSRRPSPVRRASRTREAADVGYDVRRPPGMPTSFSSPSGAGIRLPDDRRGHSFDELPRARPSMRHSETMPSPRSSAERVEREARDKLYERTERLEKDRSSGRSRVLRNENLERSASDGHRTVPRRPHVDDTVPPVSSGLRHGEHHDSGYSTSSPSETPIEHFAPPEPKKTIYSYGSPPKPDDPYVAEVRAPAGTQRRATSPPPRDRKTSAYPPSATQNDRGRTSASRSSSFVAPPAAPGLSRRGSVSARAESSGRPRAGLVRGETMPLPTRSRDSAPPPQLHTMFPSKTSDPRNGYLFGEQHRAVSPEEMERSPRDTVRRDFSSRMPADDAVYSRRFVKEDPIPASPSLGRRNSSAKTAAYGTPDRQYDRGLRHRRDQSVY